MACIPAMANSTEDLWRPSEAAEIQGNIGLESYALQPIWDHMRLEHDDFCRSPLFPVVVNVAFYFICNIPFITLDLLSERWPGFQRYKIQKDVKVTNAKITEAFLCTAYNNIMFVLPAGIYQWIYRPPVPLPELAPSLPEFCLGILGNMLLFDFQYYWWHYLHHKSRFLYKYVHKIHHEHNSPISLTTQYVSAPELLAVGFLTVVNPIILKQHFLTATVATLFNIYVSIEDHTGYEFPWSLSNLVPFGCWGGAPKHDMHHKRPLTNFEPFFTYLDKIFGTASDGGHCEAYDPLRRQRNIIATSHKHRSVTE